MDETGESIVLKPNESIIAQAQFWWPEYSSTDEYNNTLMTYDASSVFNFEQVTTN